MLLRLVTAISCLSAAAAAVAEPARLTSEALRTAFTGAMVEMDTPAGTVIPVHFTKDGLVSGKAGILASMLGAARDRGRWWAANDQLCMKWFRWFEARTRCVSVRLDGTRISWRGEDDRNGTGTIIEPATVTAAAASTRQEIAKPAKIELADTGPAREPEAPKAEASQAEEPQSDMAATKVSKELQDSTTGKAPAMRFATADLGAMSLMPALASEPSHLLDAPARPAVEPNPGRKTIESEPPPEKAALQQTVSPARPGDPPAKAPGTATGYASSTVILVSFRVAGVDEDDILNVRSGPSQHYASVGGLPPEGRGVKIVGPCRADWCPIKHGHLTGWVNRTFLAEETSGPTATALSR